MLGFYVVLIILGIICVVLSFVLAEKLDEKRTGGEAGISEEALQLFLETNKESLGKSLLAHAEKTQESIMDDVTKELNRLSNEKIMAVDEFSDTVLEKISQNHSEVIFLYNMLNEKEKELKEVLASINKVSKKSVVNLENSEEKAATQKDTDNKAAKSNGNKGNQSGTASRKRNKAASASKADKDISVELSNLDKKKEAHTREEILALHENGKSVTDIAQELQMGKGEIKLIIDLYQGAR